MDDKIDFSKIIINLELSEEAKRAQDAAMANLKQLGENARQPAEDIASSFKELAKQMQLVIAPICVIGSVAYQESLDEQRRKTQQAEFMMLDDPTQKSTDEHLQTVEDWFHWHRKKHFVGDGQTSIVDDPFNTPSITQLRDAIDKVALAIKPFFDLTNQERQAAYERSRDDLRKKTRELRKRKGKI